LISCRSISELLSMISQYCCFSSSSVVSAINFEKPTIAFRGVLISWLILARNADFNRSDCSAFIRADISSFSDSFSSVISHDTPITRGILFSVGTRAFDVLTTRVSPVAVTYSSWNSSLSLVFNNSRSSFLNFSASCRLGNISKSVLPRA